MGIQETLNTIVAWAVANPAVAVLVAFATTTFWFLYRKALGDIWTHKLQQPFVHRFLSQDTDDTETVVQDEIRSQLTPNRAGEEYHALSAEDLIDFYHNEPDFYAVTIGKTSRTYAATRVLAPSQSGALEDQPLWFRYTPDSIFALDDELTYLVEHRLKLFEAAKESEKLFNGDPFRIADITTTEKGSIIDVHRANYFDSMATHFALDYVLSKEGKTLRQILHGQSRAFDPFASSRLPNHMGLVVMIETADGRVVIQRRSSEVQVRPGTLSASVSGTFEKNDLARENELIPLNVAIAGVQREMQGEMGGKYDIDKTQMRFLGLMRECRRGGFPDFYFYYRAPYTMADLKTQASRSEEAYEFEGLDDHFIGSRDLETADEQARAAFDARVNALLERVEGKANLTLTLGIALMYEHLAKSATSA